MRKNSIFNGTPARYRPHFPLHNSSSSNPAKLMLGYKIYAQRKKICEEVNILFYTLELFFSIACMTFSTWSIFVRVEIKLFWKIYARSGCLECSMLNLWARGGENFTTPELCIISSTERASAEWRASHAIFTGKCFSRGGGVRRRAGGSGSPHDDVSVVEVGGTWNPPGDGRQPERISTELCERVEKILQRRNKGENAPLSRRNSHTRIYGEFCS